jgi:hypothetical protein
VWCCGSDQPTLGQPQCWPLSLSLKWWMQSWQHGVTQSLSGPEAISLSKGEQSRQCYNEQSHQQCQPHTVCGEHVSYTFWPLDGTTVLAGL